YYGIETLHQVHPTTNFRIPDRPPPSWPDALPQGWPGLRGRRTRSGRNSSGSTGEPSPRLLDDEVDDILHPARATERRTLTHRPVALSDRLTNEGRDLVPFARLFEGRADEGQQRLDHLGRRDGATCQHIDQVPLESEPRGAELGRAEQFRAREWDRLAARVLGVARPRQGAAEPRDHHGLVDRQADVRDAEFDRLDVRRRPDVPVDLRSVFDDPDVRKDPDQLVVLGPRGE